LLNPRWKHCGSNKGAVGGVAEAQRARQPQPSNDQPARSQKQRREGDLRTTKLTTSNGLPTAQARNETAMEKTTRAVKEITDAEATEREDKMARLRKARHEKEADAGEKRRQ
jgi:hypothetical protein